MIVSAKDLRFKISILFDVLSKGEDITISYRGKPKAKLIPYKENKISKKSELFGLWSDRDESVNKIVREAREARKLDI